MKYIEKKGLKIPAFSLGTVQLGIDYGLGDNTAKPTKEFAFTVLDKAAELGVSVLDTANNYGESECVIGEWLKTVPEDKRPTVVTKIGPFDHSSKEALREDIINQTKGCLRDLGASCLDVLMIHNYEDYQKDPDVIKEVFAQMKEAGMYKCSGVSVYSYHDYHEVAKTGFDSVQIPLNIFDWSKIEDGGIEALRESGMIVFVRSVFLQGLVFMTPDKIDPKMNFCLPYLEKLRALCDEFKVSAPTLAISFVLSLPGITSVVLGCQTPEQVAGNCDMVGKAIKLTDEQMAKIREAFVNIDERVINPRLWFNAAPAQYKKQGK